ncbi:CehA/McbA family metallohydrolase [Kitasatospora sp. NPDC056531]|uniref:CehA/McbA family metallohydrolase n=1 Tax=Kitasatospora sp. NPDC056531 TaxID=3345856 RepID=UPI003694B12F
MNDEAGRRPSEPRIPSTRVADRGRGWYRGDCHVHSAVSNGGELTPEQLLAGARAAGLDFLAVTEHNSAHPHSNWGRRADGDPLVIPGQEVTTRDGHWLALGLRPGQVVDWCYGAGDGVIDRHLAEVRRGGGLCVAAHPFAPYDSGSFRYPYRGFDLVEVWNGPWRSALPWQADNEAALAQWGRSLAPDVRRERWRPAIGNSDTHLAGQIGIPHTVALSDGLRAEAVLAGLRAGRSWLAATNAVELLFTLTCAGRTAGIGEALTIGDAPGVVARVDIRGVPSGTVSLHTGRGRVCDAALPDTGADTVEWWVGAAEAVESVFVRAEVRDAEGGIAALTNPVLLA